MNPNPQATGGFFKSSLFAALIYINYVVSIAFIVVMLFHALFNTPSLKEGAIGQNPLQQSVSVDSSVQSAFE